MASIQSIDKCPECSSKTQVVDWYYVQCTNPQCKHHEKNNLIYDENIHHD